MRLLFLSNVHPQPYAPGKGTFNAAMVQALSAEHRVRVMCSVSWVERWRGKRSDRFGIQDRNQLLGNGVVADFPTFWYPPKLFRNRFHNWLEWSLGRDLERVRRSLKPQAILSYWAHPDGTVAVRTARKWGIPAVVMVGGSDVLLLANAGARRRVILETLHQASAVICVSEDIAEKLAQAGLPRSTLHVVRRGVDRTIFHPGDRGEAQRIIAATPGRKVLLGVGRQVDVKRWDLLLRALSEVQRIQPESDWELHLCGDGPLREIHESQAAALGLQDRVQFRGNVAQSQLGDYYRAADLTLLTSDSEGVPNVLQEAIACGSRFVATDVGGVREIADPHHDRVVQAGSVNELSAAIIEQLHRPAVTSLRTYEPLSWRDSAAEITRILESVIGMTSADSDRLSLVTSTIGN